MTYPRVVEEDQHHKSGGRGLFMIAKSFDRSSNMTDQRHCIRDGVVCEWKSVLLNLVPKRINYVGFHDQINCTVFISEYFKSPLNCWQIVPRFTCVRGRVLSRLSALSPFDLVFRCLFVAGTCLTIMRVCVSCCHTQTLRKSTRLRLCDLRLSTALLLTFLVQLSNLSHFNLISC